MRKRSLILLWVAAAFIASVPSVEVQGQRGGQPVQLPEGPGKELVSTTCIKCHGLNLIPNSWGYTRSGWQQLFSSMVDLPKERADVIAEYLAKNFPQKPATPAAVIIPGNVTVNIREWMAPSLGSRPHDPLAASDGAIWWTGMYANVLGRVDPRTGDTKEYPLKTPNSGPHGLVEDRTGNIWFTPNYSRYVGKLNPKTGEVTEYPLPDPAANAPHTPTIDRRGMVWFTMLSGHVGRVNPTTGEIKIVKTPTNNTGPYGILVNSKGVPWYGDFRVNRLGSIDPATLEIKEYTLPDPAARPRRIALTPDDVVWYTDYARGNLGRFDPRTGQVREWASPGGRESRPYGIAAVGDVIWYSESGVRPNTLVRFDSKAEKFQTWTIPSGGGVVRNMMARADGNLVLACSGINRVALVEVRSGAGTR